MHGDEVASVCVRERPRRFAGVPSISIERNGVEIFGRTLINPTKIDVTACVTLTDEATATYLGTGGRSTRLACILV